MDDCVFCKIVKGEIPSYVIYEDDKIMAILDAFPQEKGHTLIIPKKHFVDLFNLPDELSKDIIVKAHEVSKTIKQTFDPEAIKIMQNNGKAAGQVVMHYHMHIIPFYKEKSDNSTDFENILKEIKNNM